MNNALHDEKEVRFGGTQAAPVLYRREARMWYINPSPGLELCVRRRSPRHHGHVFYSLGFGVKIGDKLARPRLAMPRFYR